MLTTSSAGSPASKPIRIVLADDHPVFRTGLKTMLESQQDLEVVAEAGDGAVALKLGTELEFEILLLDVSLPLLGGIEVSQKLLATRPNTKILALSAHEEPSFARMLLEAGARGYALKRAAGEELVRAIRSVAGGARYVDPTMARLLSSRRQPTPQAKPAMNLSERELEVARLIAKGQTAKEIALSLGLSQRTLETYRARAMTKLNLRSRADLIRYALHSGWLRDL